MKKKYKKIMLFLSLCLSLFIGLTVSSHAYYYDSDTGNLESSNLLSVDTSFSVGGGDGTFTRDNNSFTFNVISASDFYIVTPNGQSLTSGTYTFSLSSYDHIQLFVIQENNIWRTSSAETHTLVFDNDFNLKIRIDVDETFIGSFSFNLMVNSGSSALSYEPYGVTFYSQTNYDNYGTTQYNDGYEKAVYNLSSMFSTCSSIEQTIYNNTTTFNNSNSLSAWDNWVNQNNGRTVKLLDDRIRFFINTLIDSSQGGWDGSFTLKFNFNSIMPFTSIYDWYRLDTPGSNNQIYVYTNHEGSSYFSSTGELLINDSTGPYAITSVIFNVSTLNPVTSDYQIYTNSDTSKAYGEGYDNGFNEGKNVGIREGIASVNPDTTNFQKLIWTIGATPFESFKTIWDVDLFGLNISGIILGGLMALLVLYLIKKIWK